MKRSASPKEPDSKVTLIGKANKAGPRLTRSPGEELARLRALSYEHFGAVNEAGFTLAGNWETDRVSPLFNMQFLPFVRKLPTFQFQARVDCFLSTACLRVHYSTEWQHALCSFPLDGTTSKYVPLLAPGLATLKCTYCSSSHMIGEVSYPDHIPLGKVRWDVSLLPGGQCAKLVFSSSTLDLQVVWRLHRTSRMCVGNMLSQDFGSRYPRQKSSDLQAIIEETKHHGIFQRCKSAFLMLLHLFFLVIKLAVIIKLFFLSRCSSPAQHKPQSDEPRRK